MINKDIDKEVSSTILALSGDAPGKNKKVIKTTTPADKNTSLLMGQSKGKKGSIANAYNKFFQKVFDSNNFYKIFTDAVTGVKSTSASIKRIFEETGEDITFTNPYLLMRRLSSSLVRAKDFMENGVMLFQPVKNKFGKIILNL